MCAAPWQPRCRLRSGLRLRAWHLPEVRPPLLPWLPPRRPRALVVDRDPARPDVVVEGGRPVVRQLERLLYRHPRYLSRPSPVRHAQVHPVGVAVAALPRGGSPALTQPPPLQAGFADAARRVRVRRDRRSSALPCLRRPPAAPARAAAAEAAVFAPPLASLARSAGGARARLVFRGGAGGAREERVGRRVPRAAARGAGQSPGASFRIRSIRNLLNYRGRLSPGSWINRFSPTTIDAVRPYPY